MAKMPLAKWDVKMKALLQAFGLSVCLWELVNVLLSVSLIYKTHSNTPITLKSLNSSSSITMSSYSKL